MTCMSFSPSTTYSSPGKIGSRAGFIGELNGSPIVEFIEGFNTGVNGDCDVDGIVVTDSIIIMSSSSESIVKVSGFTSIFAEDGDGGGVDFKETSP